jgi:hypothetical protein
MTSYLQQLRCSAVAVLLTVAINFSARADYASTVLLQGPVGYWRFNETNGLVSPNCGTLGSNANATYVYNAIPGGAGPTLPGFEPANKAVSFDGTAGYVRIPGLNISTNTVTITGWVRPNGPQAGGAGMVFSRGDGTTSGLIIDPVGGLGLRYSWNNDSSTYNWDSRLALPDNAWAFVALAVTPTEGILYLGTSDGAMTFQIATNHSFHRTQAFTGETHIGDDGDSALLKGAVDEVAIFNRTLSAGEVYSQYAAAVGGLAARVFENPKAPSEPIFEGDTLRLSVDAGGTPPLTYQWRKGGVAIAGATTSTYVKTDVTASDTASYDAVITAASGSALDSAAVTVNVNPLSSPSIIREPMSRVLYPGGSLTLRVIATGGKLAYVWKRNGTAIPNATNATYNVPAVTSNHAGAYDVTVSNPLGNTSGGTAFITIPTPTPGTYEAAVIGDAPQAWWRLNEVGGATALVDAMGRHDGYYTNISGNPVTQGVPGIVGDRAVAFDGSESFGVIPYSTELNNQDFTMIAWVQTSPGSDDLVPVSSSYAEKGVWFRSYPRGQWSAGVSSSDGSYYVPTDRPESWIVEHEWTMLAISYSAGTSLRFSVNGQWDGAGYADFDRNYAGPLLIGGLGVSDSVFAEKMFNGVVDEVAIYKRALTQDQLLAQYIAGVYGGITKPVFKEQPSSLMIVVGQSASFTGRAEGSAPIGLQWYKDNIPLPGATTEILNIPKAAYADTGSYKLLATNSVGSTDSSVAVLTVTPPFAFANVTNGLVLHMAFEGDFQDSSGRGNNGTARGAPVFVTGKIGAQALQYSTDTTKAVYNYVNLGRPTDLAFSSNVNFSVSYWIQTPTNALTGDLPILASSQNSYGNAGITFAPSYDKGGWSWSLGDETSAPGVYGADASINNGQWHHVLHTFDRVANAGITYLDGVQVNSTAISGLGSIDTGTDFNLGQDASGAYAESGVATVDDLGIWRRVITASEAYAIYCTGANSGASFDTYGPVSLTIVPSGNAILLVWEAGTLLEADSMAGPWSPVSGAVAPNFRVTPGAGNKFYRVRL